MKPPGSASNRRSNPARASPMTRTAAGPMTTPSPSTVTRRNASSVKSPGAPTTTAISPPKITRVPCPAAAQSANRKKSGRSGTRQSHRAEPLSEAVDAKGTAPMPNERAGDPGHQGNTIADLAETAGPGSVDRRHLLLVGAGPGLGMAVARRFAVGGYQVTLVARSASPNATGTLSTWTAHGRQNSDLP